LWTRWWTFGFYKMLGNPWIAAQLTAPQVVLSSTQSWRKVFKSFYL
jgi:hypothetical protein